MTKLFTLRSRWAGMLIASLFAAGGLLVASPGPAHAAWAPDDFSVCGSFCEGGFTTGRIEWGNRTAQVRGDVWDFGGGTTTGVFEAYAGATKIDSETRAADDESQGATRSPRGFSFGIGDPDLRGGIDRIKVTVCFNFDTPNQSCGAPVNYRRD